MCKPISIGISMLVIAILQNIISPECLLSFLGLREKEFLFVEYVLNFEFMERRNQVLILLFIFCSNCIFAQEDFTNCSAVLLNDQMLIEEYSNTAKCKISKEAKGWLSAAAVSLGEIKEGKQGFEIMEKIEFGVAIRDGKSGTIFIYSPKTSKKINVEKVLEKCKVGDSILIMTKDVQFSLPHNDLLVY